MAKVVAFGAAAGLAGLAYYKLAAGSAAQFEVMSALGPTFRLMDAETSHNMGILAAKWGLFPKVRAAGRLDGLPRDPRLCPTEAAMQGMQLPCDGLLPFNAFLHSPCRRPGPTPPSSRQGFGTATSPTPSVRLPDKQVSDILTALFFWSVGAHLACSPQDSLPVLTRTPRSSRPC